jgi:hypothetical protein
LIGNLTFLHGITLQVGTRVNVTKTDRLKQTTAPTQRGTP